MDRQFGIKSSRRASAALLGHRNADFVGYQAFSYLDFGVLMQHVVHRGTLVDFGCGKGRVVCLAAQYAFAAVVGVEFSATLAQIARQNFDRVRDRSQCRDVQIVECDATRFSIPADARALVFFNPFRGPTLARVIENIRESAEQHPRNIQVISYGSAVDQQRNGPFYDAEWLRLRETIILPTGCEAAIWTQV